MYNNKKQHRKKQKKPQHFKEEKESQLGLDPPTHFRFFLDFFEFFQLDKTPKHVVDILTASELQWTDLCIHREFFQVHWTTSLDSNSIKHNTHMSILLLYKAKYT